MNNYWKIIQACFLVPKLIRFLSNILLQYIAGFLPKLINGIHLIIQKTTFIFFIIKPVKHAITHNIISLLDQ